MKRVVMLLCAVFASFFINADAEVTRGGHHNQQQCPQLFANASFPTPICCNNENKHHDDDELKDIVKLLCEIKNCLCPQQPSCLAQLQAAVTAFLSSSDKAVFDLQRAIKFGVGGSLFLDPALGDCVNQSPDVCAIILQLLLILSDCTNYSADGVCDPTTFNPSVLFDLPTSALIVNIISLVSPCCPQLCCLAQVYVKVIEYLGAEVATGCADISVLPCPQTAFRILKRLHAAVQDVINAKDQDAAQNAVCCAIMDMIGILGRPIEPDHCNHSNVCDSSMRGSPAQVLSNALKQIFSNCGCNCFAACLSPLPA
jgi:hypothetical protein